MATASVEPRTAAANAPSRRNLLGMIALAPAAAMPIPALASRVPSSKWDRLMRTYLAAKATSDSYDTAVYKPAQARIERVAPFPDMTFRVPDRSGYSPVFRVRETNFDEWENHFNPLYQQPAMEIKAKWLANKAANQSGRMDEIVERAEHLVGVVDEAESSLLMEPAPDRRALLWKLEQLFGEDACGADGFSAGWSVTVIEPLITDARRLLGDA